LALMLSVAGLAVGFGASYLVTPRYISTAVLSYDDTREHAAGRQDLLHIQSILMSRTSLYRLIQNPWLQLYPADVRNLPIEDVIEEMRRNIQISLATTGGPPALFRISFTYHDRLKAQATVQALASRFAEENNLHERLQNLARLPGLSEERTLIAQLESRIATLEQRAGIAPSPALSSALTAPEAAGFGNNATSVEVIDPPGLPTEPICPKRSAFAATGFGVGFVVALIFAISRRRFRSTAPIPASLA
jgi:uncharacterized protein involved in exopolysaccharide biosynthesis